MKRTVLTLLVCLNLSIALAQPGSNDPTFNPTDLGFGIGDGFNGEVSSIVLQPDGKIVVTGAFTSFNGTARDHIARLHPDGTLDTTFDPGATSLTASSYYPIAIALQPDEKIVVGGNFGAFSNEQRYSVIRLNADGSPDTTFTPGAGLNGTIYSIALQPDGKIVVGGNFTSFNGAARRKIARLHTDGSLDTTFNPVAILGIHTNFIAIALQPDGKIVVGGASFHLNGASVGRRITRLHADGSLDTTFHPGTGFNYDVYSVALQPDGKMVVGGDFTSFRGTAQNYIARLHPDGSLDTTYNTGTGFNSYVNSIALQPDGKILAGGYFTSFNGTPCNAIARLYTDGSLDTTFNRGAGFISGSVRAITPQPDGEIVVGGSFISSVINQTYITRLNADGLPGVPFNPGKGFNNGQVYSTALQPDGKIVVAGSFTAFNGVIRNGIARLHADGSLDTTFYVWTEFGTKVSYITLQPDGKMLVLIDYVSPGSSEYVMYLIRRLNADGSSDATFIPRLVNAIALQPDGKIVVGESFYHFNNTRYRINRINADGSPDTTFHLEPEFYFVSPVLSIVLQPDAKILVVGGQLNWFYNIPIRNGINRLHADGSLDLSFGRETGFVDGKVLSVALQPDGKILVGGAFTSFDGIGRSRIARLNADGSLDGTFNPGTGFGSNVHSIALQPDGKILVGGYFIFFDEISRNRITRLNADGSLDATFDPGTGFSGPVKSIALQPDGNILVGGDFISFDGIGRNRIARLLGGGGANSVEDGFGTAIRAYPNPTDDQVLIELGDVYPGVQVAVRNLTGQLLLTRQVGAARTVELNLGDLPGGMYLLDVTTRTGERTVLKVVKH